jgi:hypothetical protein
MLKTSIAALLVVASTSGFAATILTETFEGIVGTGAVNTGFDNGHVSYYTYLQGTSLTGADNGWVVTNPSGLATDSVDVVIYPDFGAIPPPGSKSLELSGSPAPGGISLTSTIATMTGVTYQLSFDYAGNPGIANISNLHSASTPFSVIWNAGTTLVSSPSPALAGLAGVVRYSATWVSDGSNLSLAFKTDLGSYSGTVIDNIDVSSISAVPEPGEWAMMIAGLGVVSVIARRRKQQA